VSLKFYNSLSGTKEIFVPISTEKVTLYACGPTVYNSPHIGKARSAVVFDLLYRVLKRHYEKVIYVRNITDLDDKIYEAAAKLQVPISEITSKYTRQYHEDVLALKTLSPTLEPKATDHINAMILMIEELLLKGHAYESESHVLFDVSSFPSYGMLSGRKLNQLRAGARVSVANYKREAADFILWKPSSSDQPGWESRWGRGRPGWHLECSAMIREHLGASIDIHGGGNDLKFPHHDNEIAQSCCANGEISLANYWMHNGFVEIDKEKMSKSVGNVLLVRDLLKDNPGEAIRLALLKTRYREPINWDEQLLPNAHDQLDRMYGALDRLDVDVDLSDAPLGVMNKFCNALDDDLNTPLALTELMHMVGEANKAKSKSEKKELKAALLSAGQQLGILQENPQAWFKKGTAEGRVDNSHIEQLVFLRNEARKNKNWVEADAARDALTELGVQILDTEKGTEWRTK
jgi:cysteinyl-tRNA synthetase